MLATEGSGAYLQGTPASSALEYSGAPPPNRLPRLALKPPDPCELLSMSVGIPAVTWPTLKPGEMRASLDANRVTTRRHATDSLTGI